MATVLAVIHNRADLRRITEALAQAGYEVASATDGLTGYDLFQQRRPAAVVISLLIPKLTGGELCQRIKTDPQGARVPVVMIGGAFKKTDMSRVALENWRADAYVPWPFETDDVLAALKDALNRAPQAAPPPLAAPTTRKSLAAETLEELLAVTVAELEESPLLDRSPRVAQINEDMAARGERKTGGGDKLDELLSEMATEVLEGESPEEMAERPSVTEPTADEADEFPREGRLEDISVVELFAQYFLSRATGILELTHRGAVKNVYFYDGRAVYVESEGRQESLGQVLVRRGLVTNDDLLLSLENMAAHGRRQGDALVEMGRLNPLQLYHGLRLQIREKLLNALGWFDGKYYFDDAPYDLNAITVFELPMPLLVYDGVVQHYDADRLREMFAEVADQVIQRTQPAPFSRGAAQLPAEVWKVLDLIDGRRTIAEVVTASGLGEARAYPILYAFVVLRLVDHQREQAPQPEAPAPVRAATKIVADEAREMAPPIVEPPGPPRKSTAPRPLKPIDDKPYVPPPEPPAAVGEPAAKEEPALALDAEIEHELRQFEEGGPAGAPHRIDRDEAAEAALQSEVLNAFLKLDRANHYQVLGVERTADETTIKFAYHARVKRFHADKLAPGVDPSLKAKANAVMQAITQAYETLGNAARRAEYDKRLTPEGEELKERRITTILAAERAFNQGVLALRRQNFVDGEKYFAEACELFPEEAEYHAYLGWAHWNNPRLPQQQRGVQAKEALERSLKINPKGDKANFFLAKLLLQHGHKDRARQLFALALRYNKNNEEAKAELLKLQREREQERQEIAAGEQKDKLGGLLKKDVDFQSVKKVIKKIFW